MTKWSVRSPPPQKRGSQRTEMKAELPARQTSKPRKRKLTELIEPGKEKPTPVHQETSPQRSKGLSELWQKRTYQYREEDKLCDTFEYIWKTIKIGIQEDQERKKERKI